MEKETPDEMEMAA